MNLLTLDESAQSLKEAWAHINELLPEGTYIVGFSYSEIAIKIFNADLKELLK